jgi:hypothetical protein
MMQAIANAKGLRHPDPAEMAVYKRCIAIMEGEAAKLMRQWVRLRPLKLTLH